MWVVGFVGQLEFANDFAIAEVEALAFSRKPLVPPELSLRTGSK